MKLNTKYLFVAVMVLYTITGCKPKQNAVQTTVATSADVSYTGEQTIVYKTRGDYSKFVPVTLNEAKTEVVSYPAPTDVYRGGTLAYPTVLTNDYWLDNRGISSNTAFLNITYDDYSKFNHAPSLTAMLEMVIDKDPFTEIYNIGSRSRFTNEVNEINDIIRKGGLKNFKRLK